MITWSQIILAALKIINWITGAVSQEQWKQSGRDEVSSKVNASTLQTQDAMDRVPRPSDSDVSDSMRSNKF